MNGKDLLNKMRNVDPVFIEEADMPPKKKKKTGIIWAAVAACLCLVAAGIAIPVFKNGTHEDNRVAESINENQNQGNLVPVSTNLMDGITANQVAEVGNVALTAYGDKMTDFAFRLFNTCRAKDGNKKNTLISPLSVAMVLSMTANGAEGDTLSEIEQLLGMPRDELNRMSCGYLKLITRRNRDFGSLKLADSIWFKSDQGFKAEKNFLQTNMDYFGAEIFKSPFNQASVNDINGWVSKKTDGMIPSIVDRIPDEAVMYMINALVFDGQWEMKYSNRQVADDTFITDDGREIVTPYLHGSEHEYLEDEQATGFIKHYKGGRYAFVALLPKEGITVDEYLASVDGASVGRMISKKKLTMIYTSMPKFEAEYDIEMSDIMKSLGVVRAFDEGEAEFKGIGTSDSGNIFINSILHRTCISVDENGTKASAVTIEEMMGGGAPVDEIKEVYLVRPFIYLLMDCETDVPLFIGVMREP